MNALLFLLSLYTVGIHKQKKANFLVSLRVFAVQNFKQINSIVPVKASKKPQKLQKTLQKTLQLQKHDSF